MSSFETSTTANSTKNVSFTASTKLNKPATSKRIKPLSRDFFTQLIKLENDFHKKLYTVSTLDELIQFYAKAVEYYDSIKDEISAYFMFKIQDILATKTSLKMLLDQKNKSGRKHDAEGDFSSPNVRQGDQKTAEFDATDANQEEEEDVNMREASSGDEDDYDEQHMSEHERKRRAKKKQPWNGRVSITMMKYEKQRFVNFFYKMETQKNSAKQTMNAVMDEFEKTSDKNDGFVKTDIDAQREKLRLRLDKRKVETFNTHSLSIQPRISRREIVEEDIIIEKKRNDMIYESFLENAEPIREEAFQEADEEEQAYSDSSDGEAEEAGRPKSVDLEAPAHSQSHMRHATMRKARTQSVDLQESTKLEGGNQGGGEGAENEDDEDEPEIL